MTDEIELNNDAKKYVLSQLIAEVKVEIFRSTCAHRAQKTVGASKEQLDALEKNLERLYGLIASYEEQQKELDQ